MNNKDRYIKEAEEHIDFIIKSNLSGKKLLKKEYVGIIEHDDKDLIIAKEIYNDLKKMCLKYREGLLNVETLSNFSANVMYKKYAPRVVSKIVNEDIYNALDFISELSFYA